MNMNEPQIFSRKPSTKASVAESTGTGGGRSSGSPMVVICLTLSVAAWGFVSYWSVSSVAYGIESAKLFPPSFGSTEVWLFALALQVIVSLFGLMLPLFFERWGLMMSLPLVVFVYLVINVFEGYHAVLSLEKSSVAPAMLARERAEVESLSVRITTANDKLTATYNEKLNAYKNLADDAVRGDDETGVPTCGKICKENRRIFATSKTRFSHLALNAAPPPVFRAVDADLRTLLTDVFQRSKKLQSAAVDLNAFYTALDKSAPPAVLTDEISAIYDTTQAKVTHFSQFHSLTPFTLALDQTNQAFSDVANGQLPAVESRLPLVYGVLPALVVLISAVFIRACLVTLGPGYYGVGHSAFAWASEGLQSKILPHVDALSAGNFMNRIRIRTRGWMGS